MKRLIARIALCALLSAQAGYAGVGDFAKDFTLMDTNGNTHSLHEVRGKIVVLEWYNPLCPFVGKHYGSGNMQRLQSEYAGKGVIWFSLVSSAKGKQGNLSADEHNKKLMEWKAAQTALLIDADGSVGRLYGARTTPHVFIIDKDGKIAYEGAIDDKPSTDPADIKTAKNYVDEALRELIAGMQVTVSETDPYGCGVKY